MDPESVFPSAINTGEKFQVLFVISSKPLGELSKTYLERPGLLNVTVCTSGAMAQDLVRNTPYDVILSDYDLDDMDAITLHLKIQEFDQKKPFLLFNITDRDREILESFTQNPVPNSSAEHDVSIIFHEQAQKIAQSVELFRTRNRLELYTRHLEELVEERTRQLQVAQRFAVIGELATMIGHDMRNPLQVITNMQYLLDMKMQKMSKEELEILHLNGIPEIFDRIGTEIQYLNKIISDLQDYAREVNPEKSRINLKTFIENLIEKISPPPSVLVKIEIQSGMTVLVDPVLLSRVMENLMINAIQAMDAGGTLTLTSHIAKDDFIITIRDTGAGISAEAQNRIFDPLFTTKPKGTGLGLSVTKRLIEAHGGKITLVETSPAGTTFDVSLPVS